MGAWRSPGVGPHGGPDTRSGVYSGPRESCGATTCALDPGRAAWPDDKRNRSIEPARGCLSATARNTRADGKKEQNFFSCVTTRGCPTGAHAAKIRDALDPRGPGAAVPVAAAPQPPVAHAPRSDDGDPVVAACSASDEPASGTPGPGNTADSNVAAGRRVRSPCANKHVAVAVACWRKRADGR